MVYNKGDVVDTKNLDADNTITFENLWIGKYIVKEKTTIDGAVLDTNEYTVSFEAKDDKTASYTETIDIVNHTTEVDISKTDITNEPEIEGATLTVKDSNGDIVDSWVSTNTSHKIEGMKVGETYTLIEELAPDKFCKANEIQFTVDNTEAIQVVKMVDKQVLISKTDATTGEELEGAKLTITDKDGNIVDEWTSTKEPHYASGLTEGQAYTLTEITAPYGFDIAESIDFTVSGDKETQKVVMTDDYIYSTVRVIKCDKTTGKAIKSNQFEFSIYSDKECKNLISISGANKDEGTALFENLKYGTYYVKETKAPMGYSLSKQVVEIVINDKGVFADGQNLKDENGVYSFKYYDELLPVIKTGDKDSRKTLVIMAIMLVIFAIIFVLVSKKMKKGKNK